MKRTKTRSTARFTSIVIHESWHFKILLTSFISTKLPLTPPHPPQKGKGGGGGEEKFLVFILQFIPNVELAAIDFCLRHYKRKIVRDREWGRGVGEEKQQTKTPLE